MVAFDLLLEIDPWEWNQVEILKNGLIEPKTLALFGMILNQGDTYVDVGAHVGFHALVARRSIGDQGRIVAIDPQPYNCNKILTNFRINDFSNVLVVVAAAGDRAGGIALHDQSKRDKSRLSLVFEPINDQPQCFQVPMIPLDDLIDDLGLKEVRLVKIDVEGFEVNVLRGLGKSMHNVQNLVIEILPDELGSTRTRVMLDMLSENGFEFRTVEGAPWEPGAKLAEHNLWAARMTHSN